MIEWYPNTKVLSENLKFSIVIPSWNNLDYLKLCVESIIKNSHFEHQIIIHVNEGSDGTLQWVKEQGLDHTWSSQNVGVCLALNACRALVKTEYYVYLNDDMYVLPDWDLELWREIESANTKYFFFSSSTIEPRKLPFPEVLCPHDYGDSPANFQEQRLLEEFKNISGHDWSGASWPPNIVHKDIWDLVGGYSIEFTPGLYSDPDFSMKLYKVGVRIFKGVNASRVYHFGSKSTRRVKENKGNIQFLFKWGLTARTFSKYFLERGSRYRGRIEVDLERVSYKLLKIRSKLKALFNCFRNVHGEL